MTTRWRATVALWRKAWCESRARFLISAGVVAGLCAVFTVFEAELRRRSGSTVPYVDYVYLRVYAGVVRSIFLILAVLFGLGGLARERAHGSLGFTLALPVSRAEHLYARAAVGLAELAALAALPVVIVPLGSSLAGEHYPWAQALGFAWLWLTVGGLAFAAALVVSVVVPRGDAALVVALVGLRVVPSVAARLPGVSALPRGLEGVMNGRGMAYFQADGHRLLYTPWTLVALIACACACTLWLAARVAAKDRQA